MRIMGRTDAYRRCLFLPGSDLWVLPGSRHVLCVVVSSGVAVALPPVQGLQVFMLRYVIIVIFSEYTIGWNVSMDIDDILRGDSCSIVDLENT